MGLRVTVTDIETGEQDTAIVAAGDYILIVADPCYRSHVQVSDGGRTHVITVKGRKPDLLDEALTAIGIDGTPEPRP